jgi:hypothetical protein
MAKTNEYLTEVSAAMNRICPTETYRYVKITDAFNKNKNFGPHVEILEKHFNERYTTLKIWYEKNVDDYFENAAKNKEKKIMQKPNYNPPAAQGPKPEELQAAFQALNEAEEITTKNAKAKVCMVLPVNPHIPDENGYQVRQPFGGFVVLTGKECKEKSLSDKEDFFFLPLGESTLKEEKYKFVSVKELLGTFTRNFVNSNHIRLAQKNRPTEMIKQAVKIFLDRNLVKIWRDNITETITNKDGEDFRVSVDIGQLPDPKRSICIFCGKTYAEKKGENEVSEALNTHVAKHCGLFLHGKLPFQTSGNAQIDSSRNMQRIIFNSIAQIAAAVVGKIKKKKRRRKERDVF